MTMHILHHGLLKWAILLYSANWNNKLHTSAFGVIMARKIPKKVMHAAYSQKTNQNSKKSLRDPVATPPNVKHIEQKSSVETQR